MGINLRIIVATDPEHKSIEPYSDLTGILVAMSTVN
jgi:hypothetical protein